MRLKGKVAIVTGGSDGIGGAIVKLFAEHGASVHIFDIDEIRGSELAEKLSLDGLSVVYHKVNVIDVSELDLHVSAIIEKEGQIDILVNNAALILTGKDPLSAGKDRWRQNFSVNLDGMWNCCRAVLPIMISQSRGNIINLGSVHSFSIVPGYFPYAVTKHAVVGLTKNLAVEYGPNNIRVNTLCPGMVETRMAFEAWSKTAEPEGARQAIANVHPLKRNASLEEIAYPALFLASDESSFMTGQSLIVDGGRSIVYHD